MMMMRAGDRARVMMTDDVRYGRAGQSTGRYDDDEGDRCDPDRRVRVRMMGQVTG